MDFKMIAKRNKDISYKERLSNQLIKFMITDKGSDLIRMIGFLPLETLMKRFEAPNLARAGTHDNQMNILLHAVKKADKEHLLRFNKTIDYTGILNKENAYDAARRRFIEDYQKNKTPVRLLPYEQKVLNKRDQWRVKTKNGKPIVKTIKDDNPGNITGVRLLYDKESGIPIYQYTPKPNPRGLAWKMHAYEEHKMAKYDKRMAIKCDVDMKSDLFPEQIKTKYKMLREAHLEQLRMDLSHLYCPTNITVVIKDNNDTIRKIPINQKFKLGILPRIDIMRGITEKPKTLPRRRTCEQFMAVSKSILNSNPESKITCLHVNYGGYNTKLDKIILPSMFSLVA